MKPRHAKGFTDYKKVDVIARHRATHGGYDSDGIPLCICTYPLIGVAKLQREEKSHGSTEAKPKRG
jgi:hypothetical protein